VLLFALLGAYGLAASYVYLAPTLPSAEAMRKVELQIPLRVYTRNGALMAQIGEQRRIPVTYAQIPAVVKQAFLAAEDERDDWQSFGKAQLAKAYGTDEPDYSELNLKSRSDT